MAHEPRDTGEERQYYTFADNGITLQADKLVTTAVKPNRYVMNCIDQTLLFPDTGDIAIYGMLAILGYLEKQYTTATHFVRSLNADPRLLEDFMHKKHMFYYGNAKAGVWRLLTETRLGKNLLGDTAATREEIVEFLVTNVYAKLSAEWAKITEEG